MYHHAGYNNVLHLNSVKIWRKVSTQKYFSPSYYFLNIYLGKHTYDRTILYHFLQYILLNYDKNIATKHISHIYYLTNVYYTEKGYTLRNVFEVMVICQEDVS